MFTGLIRNQLGNGLHESLRVRSGQALRRVKCALQDDKGVNMLDHSVLSSVAEQMMSGREVTVEGRTSRVSRTGAQRLRTVRFLTGGREYQAIEQNPEKPSRWGKLAREGHRVVQVRDLGSQKYVAAVVDGKVTEYSR